MIGKGTRKDLASCIRQLKGALKALANARCGLHGAVDSKAFRLQRELGGIVSGVKGLGRNKPQAQLELKRAA